LLGFEYHFNKSGPMPRFANNYCKEKVNTLWNYKLIYEPNWGSSKFSCKIIHITNQNFMLIDQKLGPYLPSILRS